MSAMQLLNIKLFVSCCQKWESTAGEAHLQSEMFPKWHVNQQPIHGIATCDEDVRLPPCACETCAARPVGTAPRTKNPAGSANEP